MRIDIITIFPEMFDGPLDAGILKRARENGLVDIRVLNLRDYTHDRHRTTDDVAYGGGGGMVMKPEPIFEAVGAARGEADDARVILMCPQGEPFTQEKAWALAAVPHLILICGRYEGVDERVRVGLKPDEISVGDYVLSGGELPALVVVDAVVRLVPGVIGDERAAVQDSFASGLLEGPHYTRPRSYRGLEVPAVLLSGDHERIRRWRRKEALRRTRERRPDLLAAASLTPEDRQLLAEIEKEDGGVI